MFDSFRSGSRLRAGSAYSPPSPTFAGATGFRRRLDRVRCGGVDPPFRVGRPGIRGRPAVSSQPSRKDRPTMPRPHRIAHRLLIAVLAIVGLVVPLTGSGLADASPSHHSGPKPTIVLVHGDWADASSWNTVIAKPPSPRLHRRRPAQPVPRSDRCPVPGGLPGVGARADRAGRPLLRGVRHHQRGDRQHQRQGAGLHRRVHPRRGSGPGRPEPGLVPRPGHGVQGRARARVETSTCTCKPRRTAPIRASRSASPTA